MGEKMVHGHFWQFLLIMNDSKVDEELVSTIF